MAPSKTQLRNMPVKALHDLFVELRLIANGTDNKQQLEDRPFNHYKIPLSAKRHRRPASPLPQPMTIAPSPVSHLEERSLTAETVNEITAAGFTTVSKLMRLAKSAKYPSNLTFISLLADRNEVEIFFDESEGKPVLDDVLSNSDLRAMLDRSGQSSRGRSAGKTRRRRERSHSTSVRSKSSSSSRSMSHSGSHDRSAKLGTVACNIPRTHRYVQPRNSLKKVKKVKPSDLTVDKLFAYDFRILLRLARMVSGDHADCLAKYAEFYEFLANMRCNYNDDAVLKFEDDFRRCAKSDQFSLNDERNRKFWLTNVFMLVPGKLIVSVKEAKTSPLVAKGRVFPNGAFNFLAVSVGRKVDVLVPPAMCL